MPGSDGAAVLYGRERELTRIADAVARLEDHGGGLVVRGSAGVGKSALLAAAGAAARSRGVRVLAVTGAESEAGLPFAGLHQMLGPLLGDLDELAGPQGDALRVAFGMSEGPAPEVFFVGLAALHLIGLAAGRAPLVLSVDDAHWLDRASASVLAFVARRLDREAVLVLVAEREGHVTPLDDLGLPHLRLEPLDAVAAGRLLDARAPDLPREARERALVAAAGNPLALVELPLTPDGAQAPWLPLTGRLERAFSVRAADLPDAARAVLLMLAVEEGGRVSELLAAAASLLGRPIDVDDLSPAVARGLVEVAQDRVRFRHPLMRSAVHQAATAAERHRAHAAMAAATGDPDRRAWHRAAAALGPDEAVAAELEAAAARWCRRGAVAVAVAALERAAQISAEPGRRDRRLLRAAELGFELGRADLVDRILRALDPSALSPPAQAQLLWLSGVFDGRRAGGRNRLDELLDRAGALAGGPHRELAGRLLWSAAIQSWWSDDAPPMRRRLADAADRLAADDPVRVACLAFAAPVERGAAILAALPALAGDADVARVYGTAANAIGAFDRSAVLLATAADGLRAQGRLGLLARTLTQQAWSAAQRGDLRLALAAAAEAQELTAETGQPTIHATAAAVRALVAALRGDAVEESAALAEGFGLPAGARALLALVQHARGVDALGRGLPVEALEHLQRVHDPADPAHHSFLRWLTVADLADAAVRSGRADAAREIVADLVGIAGRSPVSLLQAGARYSLALLAGDGDAETRFQYALAATAAWPFLHARTQLALGAWLRRQRRAADSRAPLRAARDAFDALGTGPWADRAREELRASGETSRRRVPEARDQLTPQELEVARLAAGGLTNLEIARHLYVSHRTVSSHLYKIFPKLGITSRAELAGALRVPAGPASLRAEPGRAGPGSA